MSNAEMLRTPIRYYPHEKLSSTWKSPCFRHDERKVNLLWLVVPECDAQWYNEWSHPVMGAIDTYYYVDLQRDLTLPPLAFMDNFSRIAPTLAMVQEWPEDFLETMWGRAHEANARLTAGLAPNVVKVDFVSRRKYG